MKLMLKPVTPCCCAGRRRLLHGTCRQSRGDHAPARGYAASPTGHVALIAAYEQVIHPQASRALAATRTMRVMSQRRWGQVINQR